MRARFVHECVDLVLKFGCFGCQLLVFELIGSLCETGAGFRNYRVDVALRLFLDPERLVCLYRLRLWR